MGVPPRSVSRSPEGSSVITLKMEGGDQKCCVLKKVSMVSMWSFAVDTEICGICKQSNHDVCINCEVDGLTDCDIAVGECNHVFHWHCIESWLRKKTTCPLCSTEWGLALRTELNPST